MGSNEGLDYTTLGNDPMLAADYDANVERLTAGKGRKQLEKAFFPTSPRGAARRSRTRSCRWPARTTGSSSRSSTASTTMRLTAGNKAFTQTWINTYGHCVFSEQEVTARSSRSTSSGSARSAARTGRNRRPTDISNACLGLPGGVDGDTCSFNTAFSPGAIYDRIPAARIGRRQRKHRKRSRRSRDAISEALGCGSRGPHSLASSTAHSGRHAVQNHIGDRSLGKLLRDSYTQPTAVT